MKRMLVLMILMIAAVNIFALKINEFIVQPLSSEAIELYNESVSSLDVNNYIIITVGSGYEDTTYFKSGTISADGYKVFNMGTIDFSDSIVLSDSGLIIKLYNDSGTLLDSVGYGDFGSAPRPIHSISCARVADTGDNAVDFNMDFTPTMGNINNCPANAFGTGTVFYNEVFHSDSNDNSTAVLEYIELYNNSNSSVDLSEWVIVCDDDYYVPVGTNILPYGYYVLYDTTWINSSAAPYFYLDSYRENLYLFNSLGNRIDQLGWSDSLKPDSSFSVRPNGVRTYFKGYNESTSVDFEYYTPTPGAVNPVDEVYSINGDKSDVKVQSLSNVGIMIENPSNINGTMEILDINGRVLYSTFIKNLVFDTKAGTYFVKTNINGDVSSVKVNVIK